MPWPFQRRRPSQHHLDAIARTTEAEKTWLLRHLASLAPTAVGLAVRDLEQAKSGAHCLRCRKAWPRPTEPAVVDGICGFVCPEHLDLQEV